MLPTDLDDLTPAHIQSLIDSEIAETLTLEYKRGLPGGQSEEKREFLYDIAALANAAGGDIIYGIEDRRGEGNQATGIPECLSGIRIANPQAEVSRLTNLIRDGISPRVAGIEMGPVTCPDGDALVIRIPRSWNKPHMVTMGGMNKFFGRVGTTKYPMSVDEIRRSFSQGAEFHETIARWRLHRAELVGSGTAAVPLAGAVTMLFHVIPASAFTGDVLRETWTVSEDDKLHMYVPHGPVNFNYNADGFLCLAPIDPQSKRIGYTQLFRSGIVEYADSSCYTSPFVRGDSMIIGQELEKQMVNCYGHSVNLFRKRAQSEILYIGFSLVGIANKAFYSTPTSLAFRMSSIVQDVFISPEVFVDLNTPEEPPFQGTLLPLVDTMWQVAGIAGTPFKSKGEWNPFGRYV